MFENSVLTVSFFQNTQGWYCSAGVLPEIAALSPSKQTSHGLAGLRHTQSSAQPVHSGFQITDACTPRECSP